MARNHALRPPGGHSPRSSPPYIICKRCGGTETPRPEHSLSNHAHRSPVIAVSAQMSPQTPHCPCRDPPHDAAANRFRICNRQRNAPTPSPPARSPSPDHPPLPTKMFACLHPILLCILSASDPRPETTSQNPALACCPKVATSKHYHPRASSASNLRSRPCHTPTPPRPSSPALPTAPAL